MSPTRLVNIELSEVSTVRRGAGKGCEILIRKNHDEGKIQAMETVAIKKAFTDGNFHRAMSDTITLRKRHEISSGAFNEIYKHAAVTTYPLAKSPAEAMELYRQTPGGSRMFAEGLAQDFADMQRDTARANASLVAKSKRPHIEHASNESVAVDGDEPDDDPDDQLRKLGGMYRLAHPAAKFTREAAIAHVMQHDPDGRRLAAQSKRKNIARYGEKFATYFDKAQSGAARTVPPPQPDVRRDPANREQLSAGQSAVDGGHQEGRDFQEQVKRLMNEQGISRDEAISQLYVAERRAKFGW